MTLRNALSYFRRQLATAYEPQEAKVIAEISLQHIANCSHLHLFMHGEQVLDEQQLDEMYYFIDSLLQYCPLQHLTCHTKFCGLYIECSPAALIPRPETEELVAWILDTCKIRQDFAPSILDIGTGTGCIALALQRYLPEAIVQGMDISTDALALAQRNAQRLHLPTQFWEGDILKIAASLLSNQEQVTSQTTIPPLSNEGELNETKLPIYDIIVSNPPYIAQHELPTLHAQVTDYEPHLALFVPDHDPLLFYRAIAQFALQHLPPLGYLFVETHEKHARRVAKLFIQSGLEHVEVRRDINGKERMVRATNPKR